MVVVRPDQLRKRVHPEKKGFRVLGIAESFTKNSSFSTLSGVVLRRDMIIDGIVIGKTLVGGNDATEQIISMFTKLDRSDINCIMINGLIISLYNVVGGEKILQTTGIPVIGVSYEESTGIENAFFKNFNDFEAARKAEAYRKLGNRESMVLKTGMSLFIRSWGISAAQSLHILNGFAIQGRIPEPLRIAKLISRAARNFSSE
jgi:endonuclease V-like protein UPF0215 family